jgi:hypothetical protein
MMYSAAITDPKDKIILNTGKVQPVKTVEKIPCKKSHCNNCNELVSNSSIPEEPLIRLLLLLFVIVG